MVVARDRKSSISGTENVVFVGAEAGRALADVDQAILIAIDERPEQHLADDAEDRGVGADAERERDGDGGGEALGAHAASAGRPACPARAPSAASNQRLRQTRRIDSRVSVTLPNSLQRGEAGRFRILAALDAFLDADRDVAADLVVELVARRGASAHPLRCRRRVHDAPDRVHELRPSILLAQQLGLARRPSAGRTSPAGWPRSRPIRPSATRASRGGAARDRGSRSRP